MTTISPALEAVLQDLNPRQREAAVHGMTPLLIIAGAGTGKTTTLAHRVATLIAGGVPPERVLLLTFSRRAAGEMMRRVDGILRALQNAEEKSPRGSAASRRVWGGTFHAVATRLLRSHGKAIGLSPGFTILDRGDAEDLIHVVRQELKLAEGETRFPVKRGCMEIYSRSVSSQVSLQKVLTDSFPWCMEHETKLKTLFRTYVDRKEELNVLDYDDLLLFWKALAQDESAGAKLRELFDCVLVDEYQDTNAVQAQILKGMCPDGEGLTVVGDDAQSIYSFRAATIRNILDFPEHYPGTTVVKLEQNYRSTQPILDATNRIIAAATERHEKDLWSSRKQGARPQMVLCEDEDEQTQYLIERILEHRENGTELRKQAVLFRASHHSIALEVELNRRNIPFHKYGGLKFVEAAHVKDLMAFLRLAENPRDVVSGIRVLVLIPGIGQVRARQLMELLTENRGDFSCWETVKAPKAAREDWPRFVALVVALSQPSARKSSVNQQVHRVRVFYGPLLEQKYDHASARLKDLEQLELISGKFRDRLQFVTEMTLDPPASTQDLAGDPLLDDDFLILSTIHSAKGLEWNCVYVIHAVDGNIPSDMATVTPEEIEEERRLFYVALTRARDWLYVTVPQRYYQSRILDTHSYAQPTRFLTKPALQCFESTVALINVRSGDDEPPTTSSSEVRQSIKDMWS